MEIGFDKEQVLVIDRFDVLESQQAVYKEEALRHSDILQASITDNVPGGGFSGNGILVEGGKSTEVHVLSRFYADYDLCKTLGISMAEGRFYSKEHATDSSAIVLNQEAVRSLGLDDPFNQYLIEPSDLDTKRPVIGIVKDFHFQSAHNPDLFNTCHSYCVPGLVRTCLIYYRKKHQKHWHPQSHGSFHPEHRLPVHL